jgi:hypothetical protein
VALNLLVACQTACSTASPPAASPAGRRATGDQKAAVLPVWRVRLARRCCPPSCTLAARAPGSPWRPATRSCWRSRRSWRSRGASPRSRRPRRRPCNPLRRRRPREPHVLAVAPRPCCGGPGAESVCKRENPRVAGERACCIEAAESVSVEQRRSAGPAPDAMTLMCWCFGRWRWKTGSSSETGTSPVSCERFARRALQRNLRPTQRRGDDQGTPSPCTVTGSQHGSFVFERERERERRKPATVRRACGLRTGDAAERPREPGRQAARGWGRRRSEATAAGVGHHPAPVARLCIHAFRARD